MNDDPAWAEAAAAFGASTPVQLVRPARRITVRYRYEDGLVKAMSPQVTGFEVAGADLEEARELVRQGLGSWLDPAVEVDEVISGEPGPAVCPKCGTAACLEDKALDW